VLGLITFVITVLVYATYATVPRQSEHLPHPATEGRAALGVSKKRLTLEKLISDRGSSQGPRRDIGLLSFDPRKWFGQMSKSSWRRHM